MQSRWSPDVPDRTSASDRRRYRAMASLKDLRNRIASTKATQKITKAMQMVAASKLRRAQAAAEAARPYADADGQGARQHRRRGRQARHRAAAAARHRQRQRPSAGRLHRRARPVRRRSTRRSCGSRASAPARSSPRQGGQVLLRRPQGLRSAAPALRKQIIEMVDLRAVRTLEFRARRGDRGEGHRAVREGEFDVCTLFFSRFRSVIAQIPTAQQIIPPVFDAKASGRASAAPSTSTSRKRRTSSPSSCRATSRCRSSARCWRTPPRSTARR